MIDWCFLGELLIGWTVSIDEKPTKRQNDSSLMSQECDVDDDILEDPINESAEKNIANYEFLIQ